MNLIFFLVGLFVMLLWVKTSPYFFGLVHEEENAENFDRAAQATNQLTKALDGETRELHRADFYEGLVKQAHGSNDALTEKVRALTREVAALKLRGDENCPHCDRLRKRIRRFFEQKKLVKQAYVDRVMMVSHGQVDTRALVDPERYLLVDDASEIRTYGEIRDSEIDRSLQLLKPANVDTSEKKG